MSAMFRSLRRYNYRTWFIGGLISSTGQWMQMTAQSWVVLTVLTEGDAAAMGVSMALQFAPPLLLVGPAGWVSVRSSRRRSLAITRAAFMLLAISMGLLLLTGIMTLPMMYGFAVALGVVAAFDNPARQVFVSDLVTAEDTSNAVALNSALFNMARLVGPAVAGIVVVAVGGGWVFKVNASRFLAVRIDLALLRVRELTAMARMATAEMISSSTSNAGGTAGWAWTSRSRRPSARSLSMVSSVPYGWPLAVRRSAARGTSNCSPHDVVVGSSSGTPASAGHSWVATDRE